MYQQDDLIDAETATPATEDQSTLDGTDAAVRLLEIATRSADELIGEAQAEAASLVAIGAGGRRPARRGEQGRGGAVDGLCSCGGRPAAGRCSHGGRARAAP